jgi:hypothetical protein
MYRIRLGCAAYAQVNLTKKYQTRHLMYNGTISMKYKHCRQCHFWVKAREPYCPNCGVVKPAVTSQHVEWWTAQQSVALIAGCLSVAIVVSIIRAHTTPFGYAIGGIVIMSSLMYYGIVFWKTKQFSSNSSTFLTRDEALIHQRLEEIETRRQRIYGLLQHIGIDGKSGASAPLIETLKQALTTLQIQYSQYRAKLWDIALLRWSNMLRPVVEDWNQVTYEQCQVGLQELTQISDRGSALLQHWKSVASDALAEKQCIARLQEALAAIQKLQEAMQAKQIALTVQGISRFDDETDMLLSRADSLGELAIFTTLSDLRLFSSSFQELEDEYFRLKSEEEISEK